MEEKGATVKSLLEKGKQKFRAGQILDSFEYYEGVLAADNEEPVLANVASRAIIQADYARKLTEIELFPQAEQELMQAGELLGEIESNDVEKNIAFWKVKYAYGKLMFRSMYQQRALETFE